MGNKQQADLYTVLVGDVLVANRDFKCDVTGLGLICVVKGMIFVAVNVIERQRNEFSGRISRNQHVDLISDKYFIPWGNDWDDIWRYFERVPREAAHA